MRSSPPSAAWWLLGVLISASMAGCLGGGSDGGDGDGADEGAEALLPDGRWATVALVDTGINPYHIDFRLTGELAHLADVHPSRYIPGYPADVERVDLTFDAENLTLALEADADAWAQLEAGKLYWFAGTRVTGISIGGATGEYSIDDEDVPVYSTGHGTMVASKAAGNAYGTCPACHIVAIQGFDGESVLWASEQSWIDVQSNSWGPIPAFAWADAAILFNDPELNRKMSAAAADQAVFVASGNGIAGALGVVGFPSPVDSTSGPPGVISVGGHDNGKATLWTGWFPHIVADACDNWAAVGASLDEYSDSAGGGTSSASPYSAGLAAQIVHESRGLLGSTEPRNGTTLASQGAGASAPQSGPLADGDLTLDELKSLLFHTAKARPTGGDAAEGAECPAAHLYHTSFRWEQVPDAVPTTYPWIGYGQVDGETLAHAVDVLKGTAAPNDRPDADDMYERDQELRRFYHENSPQRPAQIEGPAEGLTLLLGWAGPPKLVE